MENEENYIPDAEVESQPIPVKTSILLLTKKKLGINPEDKAFDDDIIADINAVLMGLSQMGIGPKKTFVIEDETSLWTDFIGENENLEPVKTYMYMKVRMMFDPPTSGSAVESLSRIISELEWRLCYDSEITKTDTEGDDKNDFTNV